ncbi:MAG TPA: type II toxin-antitoxin system Phd/YefM family antitoxin [Deltaproteobacteria bacterium]|nr:type II toxin-antitoxin system Phd/YefM family antitoxin [Deltaproteobacteria bacterium]
MREHLIYCDHLIWGMEGELMETIGIRLLKENLSRYMKQVKSGETIIVTDRKKEIAVIMPFEKGTHKEERILQLIQRGMASWSGGKPCGMTSRIASRGKSVSGAVIEDRR